MVLHNEQGITQNSLLLLWNINYFAPGIHVQVMDLYYIYCRIFKLPIKIKMII